MHDASERGESVFRPLKQSLGIFELCSMIETDIHVLGIGSDVNESLPLLAGKGKGVGDTIGLINQLAAFACNLENCFSGRQSHADDGLASVLKEFTQNEFGRCIR